MNTATMPEPEKTTVVFPDWVLVDRSGRIKYYDDGDPVHEDLKKAVGGSTAAAGVDSAVVGVETSSGHSGYFSFTLATPPRLSYLDLYWPKGSSGFPIDTIYSSLLGADKDLLLLRIAIHGCYYQFPQDLFVYTAAGPRPSLMHLPLNTVPAPKVEVFRNFFESKFDIGILRLPGDQSHYVVADLVVSNGDNKIAQLCVFSTASKTRIPWRAFIKTLPQPSDGGQFPICWLTNTVIPLDGRFLCWVDYYSGLLLSDFSEINAPVLRFVPFPGEKYTDDVLRSTQTRCCPDRYRSVSISQGKLRFVHIDNHFYKRNRIDIDDEDTDTDDDEDDTGHENSDPKITIWTLNVAEFKWEIHRKLDLHKIWAQPMYKQERIRPGRLPEFPVISVDNTDLVWCLLRQKEFRGKTWMAEVDLERQELRTCTPYVNEQPNCVQDMELKNSFADEPPLPTVFSKYLKNTTGGNVKFATRSSKRARL